MLPGVIVSFFTMIIFFLSPILMPMLKKFHLSRYIPHIYHELKQLPESSFILVYIILGKQKWLCESIWFWNSNVLINFCGFFSFPVVYSIYMWIVKYSIYRFIKNPNAEQDILPTYEKDTVICPAEKPQQTESDDKNCWLTMNDVVATNPTVFFPTNLWKFILLPVLSNNKIEI